MRLSYVNSGSGKKYVKTLGKDEKLVVRPSKVVYSKADGSKKEYTI